MSRDNDDSVSEDGPSFVGEEEVAEPVTAKQNLAAAVVIGAVAILALVLAVRLEVPGELYTAPGLLPFIVSLSLFFMALGLGAMAVRDGGAKDFFDGFEGPGAYFQDVERLRTFLLLGIIVVYIVLVDLVAFEWRLPIGGFEWRFGGYELFSIAALTLILRIFWKRPLAPHCLGVSAGMVLALASVFRYGFRILLPGVG